MAINFVQIIRGINGKNSAIDVHYLLVARRLVFCMSRIRQETPAKNLQGFSNE